jgi:acyl carrier protein
VDTDTKAATHDDVLAELTILIREVLDGYHPNAMPVTRETSFQRDLAFESIDIVVLSSRLTEIYGAAVNFPGYLRSLSIDQIIDLRVGDVVDHVTESLARS